MVNMTPKPKLFQSRIIYGCAEGTNGVLCDLKKEYPYNMIFGSNVYVAEHYNAHKMETQNG